MTDKFIFHCTKDRLKEATASAVSYCKNYSNTGGLFGFVYDADDCGTDGDVFCSVRKLKSGTVVVWVNGK